MLMAVLYGFDLDEEGVWELPDDEVAPERMHRVYTPVPVLHPVAATAVMPSTGGLCAIATYHLSIVLPDMTALYTRVV